MNDGLKKIILFALVIVVIIGIIFLFIGIFKKKSKPTTESRENLGTIRVGRLKNFPPFWYESFNKNGDRGIDYDVTNAILNRVNLQQSQSPQRPQQSQSQRPQQSQSQRPQQSQSQRPQQSQSQRPQQSQSQRPQAKEIEFITFDNFEQLYDALKQGKIDIIVNNLWSTPKRSTEFNFTYPYSYQDGIAMTFKKDGPEYKTAKDLEGKTVGVLPGGDEENWLPKNVERKYYNSVDELISAVANGQVDASIEGYSTFFVTDKKLQDMTKTVILEKFPSSIALRKDNDKLLEMLNEAIKSLWNDSSFYWIKMKYLPEYAIESYNYAPDF
jgi:ABC-type amino acid transport substrate-binding protein